MMDSGRLIFDSTSYSSNPGYTLFFQERNEGERSLFGMEQRTNKRLPFFTSSEELEEEYYDEQLPEKKRRLTAEQVHMLEKSFESENKLEPERKGELAKKLGLQPRQVAVWFQNRRARWKTKQLEHDYDRLKAAYDALLADHDSLLKDNNGLHSQVANLNEKLQNKQIAAGHASESSTDTDSKVDSIHVVNFNAKAEDYQSTGSGGSSAVLDKESYFHENFDDCIVGAALDGGGGDHSEEDDGSDDGCNYMPGGIFGENNNTTENWWGVWN